jgi:CRP-like cAMP-binding protein
MVRAQLLQAMQYTRWNAKHWVEQKLARWLLLCADRAQSKTFRLSQEDIADLLGSTPSYTSVAAGILKSEGLVEYTRGNTGILDAEKLRKPPCKL